MGARSKEPACECRRLKRSVFDHWIGKIPWRRAWQPSAVFLPGEFDGQRSPVGYSPWGGKESDTTERPTLSFSIGKKGRKQRRKEGRKGRREGGEEERKEEGRKRRYCNIQGNQHMKCALAT